MPAFQKPEQLRRIEIDQLRSHLYPGAPWLYEPAYQRYVDGRPIHTRHPLPQAIGFNKWLTPPPGYDRSFAPSAREVKQLGKQRPSPLHPYEPVPFQTITRVAAPLNRLPSQAAQVDMNPAPLARNVLQRTFLVDGPTMRALSRTMTTQVPAYYGTTTYVTPRQLPSTYTFVKR